MRAGPLSDPKVIRALNAHFVNVFTSNEDYFGDAAIAPKEELAELERIHREGHAAKKSVGTVHAYFLSPDGKLVDSLHVAKAAEKDHLWRAIAAVRKSHPSPAGEPLVKPRKLGGGAPPSGGVVVHVTARREGRGSWGEFPGENWVTLSAEDWRELTAPGDSRQVADSVSRRILNHFHPQTEDCSDKDRNDLRVATLTATTEADGVVRLRGKVNLRRAFYPGRQEMIEAGASLEGFVRDGKLALVALEDARFGKEKFFAAAVAER